MARDLLLGQLHPDLVCAIALGFVDHPRVTVTLDAVTLADAKARATTLQTNWLTDLDPLDVLTRQYLTARLDAMKNLPRPGQPAWATSKLIKTREDANARALQAKSEARKLLQQRGILQHALHLGLKVHEAA